MPLTNEGSSFGNRAVVRCVQETVVGRVSIPGQGGEGVHGEAVGPPMSNGARMACRGAGSLSPTS